MSSPADRTPSTPASVADPVAPASPAPAARRRAETATPGQSVEPAAVVGITLRLIEKDSRALVVGAAVEVWIDDAPRKATTDAEGVARVPGPVPADGARVRVRPPGRQALDRAASAPQLSGEKPMLIDLRLGATVDGVVLETDGRPIAGAHVKAVIPHADGFDDFPDDDSDSSVPPLSAATTGADGAFRVDGLPANYKSILVFGAPRHVGRDVPWDRESPPRVEVRLAAAGVVRGVVRDPSGAGAARAGVVAMPDTFKGVAPLPWQADWTAKTDAEGRYELDGLPLDGNWTLTASKDGFAVSTSVLCAMSTVVGAEGTCDLVLRPRARIAVVVLDSSGRPAARAHVRYDCGREWESKDVDAEGRCAFTVARPGACRLFADAPDVGSGGVDVEAVAGETASVMIRLARGVALVGVVVDDRGAPVRDAFVEVVAHGEDVDVVRRSASCDEDGAFRVEGVPPGRYGIIAKHHDHEDSPHEEFVAPAADLRLTIRRAGHVSLRLRPPAGGPSPGRWNFSRHEVGDAQSVAAEEVDWADEASTFDLPPGKWDLYAESNDFVYVRRTVDVAPGETTALGDVVLDPGATLVGRVVDAKGRGIPEARVECCSRFESTDETGAFKIAHVARGEQRVGVTSDDFLAATAIHSVAADSQPLVVKLARGCLLCAFVHDAAGKPVTDVEVVVSRDGATVAGADVDWRGTRAIRLAPGRYGVVVKRDDAVLATKEVELLEGADAALSLVTAR